METGFDLKTVFENFWPLITGGLTIPLMYKLKKLVGWDWPLLWAVVMVILNSVAALGICAALGLPLDVATLWPYITAGSVVSVVGHAAKKNVDKKLITK